MITLVLAHSEGPFHVQKYIVIAAMAEPNAPAVDGPTAALPDTEHELEQLLVEYGDLTNAWSRLPHVLDKARIGRRVEHTLSRIYELHQEIAGTQADGQCHSGGSPPFLTARMTRSDAYRLFLRIRTSPSGGCWRRTLTCQNGFSLVISRKCDQE